MNRRPHAKAAAIVSSFVAATLFAASTALASTSFAPPPPPDEAPAPGAAMQMQQASPLDQFRQTLAHYGSFHTHPLYGEVWKPSEQVAPQGWSPYPVCHWQFDREQRSWVFNDPTDWGSIVHRHGRWANDPQHGWIWVADANFGPGWVIWRSEARNVSWAPMLPEQLGNQPPRDGWQSQDLASLHSGCRQSAPPAPAAGYQPLPDPGPAPMPMMAHGGPSYGHGGPVFIPGRPIFVPGRPPVIGGGLPPACSTGIRPSWCRPVCAVRPHAPGCRPHGPHIGHRPGHIGNPCGRFPTLVACRSAHRPFAHRPLAHRPFVHRPFHTPRFVGRPGHHRPFVGQFRGSPRMAMGHRGFSRR